MIRTVHPFYLLGFMLVLLMTLVWQNAKIENEISHKRSERLDATVMAKRILELKKVMKTTGKGQLEQFLDGSLFSGAELTHRTKNGHYVVNAQKMSARQLQSFLNRILNMNLKVVQLKIKTQSEQYTSLYMEISL